jgi:hypothetical protein
MGSCRAEAPLQAYPSLLSLVDLQRHPTASFLEVGSADQLDKLSPASMTITNYYKSTDCMSETPVIRGAKNPE